MKIELLVAAQQHLEAAARTGAELKAGQPVGIVLRIYDLREGDAGILDAQVAAIRVAGGGKVAVRWESLLCCALPSWAYDMSVLAQNLGSLVCCLFVSSMVGHDQ